MIPQILAIGLVCLLVVYITISYIRSPIEYQGPSPTYDLGIPYKKVLPSSILSWNLQPCYLRFGMFIQSAPKTISKVDCSMSPTDMRPSCEDYTLKACPCAGVDCSPCTIQDITAGGYMSKLLYVGDSVELWASGYTSTNDKPDVPTVLKVKTGKDANTFYMETISLPAIPLQKWTIITIVKEGRRFDVYYGAKQVAVKYLSYVPVADITKSDWTAGNASWGGSIGFFSGGIGQRNSEQVERDVAFLVNTRGVPHSIENPPLSFTMPSIAFCPFGNCSSQALPVVSPPNQFAMYASNVS